MNWIKIIIASIFEVGWVIGLTHATTGLEWMLTIIAIFLSFYLLIDASKMLPIFFCHLILQLVPSAFCHLFLINFIDHIRRYIMHTMPVIALFLQAACTLCR